MLQALIPLKMGDSSVKKNNNINFLITLISHVQLVSFPLHFLKQQLHTLCAKGYLFIPFHMQHTVAMKIAHRLVDYSEGPVAETTAAVD